MIRSTETHENGEIFTFDATEWFQTASAEAIRDLRNQSYPALVHVLESGTHLPAYILEIDRDQAEAWLRQHRPDVA